jgi:hypothetical protein
MPTNEHLVLCSGANAMLRGEENLLTLNLHGASANVRLEIEDISRRLLANLSDVHADLLEIAGYVYAADSAVSRGGKTDSHLGAMWCRKFRFVIPVRQPGLWSSDTVTAALAETISFLSDDDYEFQFRQLGKPPSVETYFAFSGGVDAKFTPDDVILFSGGLDSFAGTVEELVAHGKKVALVSHRSASKITEAQNYLIRQLRLRFGPERVLHIPVRANLKGDLGNEPTHRTRSFLFAAIGAVTGHLLDRQRMFFFENGESEFAAGRPGCRSQSDADHASPSVSWISAHLVRDFRSAVRCQKSLRLDHKGGGYRAYRAMRLHQSHQAHAKLCARLRHDHDASSLRTRSVSASCSEGGARSKVLALSC